MSMVVVVQKTDHGCYRAIDGCEQARSQPGRAADDEVDRPRPALLEHFPATVRIAEAALSTRDQVTADSRATPPTPKVWISSPFPTDSGQDERGASVWQ